MYVIAWQKAYLSYAGNDVYIAIVTISICAFNICIPCNQQPVLLYVIRVLN